MNVTLEKYLNQSLNEFNHDDDWTLKVNNASRKKVIGLEGYGIKISKQEIIK